MIYLIMRIPALKKGMTSSLGIKARIVLGCLGAGVFLGIAIFSGDIKEIIIVSIIVSLVIYGAVSLQNKFLYVKK
ncbi:hypothetical protein [Daejeonella sp. H1SJ63]|uniref:hypothetical protein n=1 Tax=Daejeonella sp. H1SJ63 TaxID=3034145 RepID=UPI0023EAEC0E|nr:hypothetical protein [Daejeonella sp. H1SJ63]